MKTVSLKLANMRKAQEFVVSATSDGRFILQSDKAIGIFKLSDGIGKLNTKGCYFPHLTFAAPYNLTVPELLACREALTKPGDVLGMIGSSPVVYMGTKII
jgi:hypothetical protein